MTCEHMQHEYYREVGCPVCPLCKAPLDSKLPYEVSMSNDGTSWVIKRALEQVFIDVYGRYGDGSYEIALSIASLLNKGE